MRRTALAATAAVTLTACASTSSFHSTWRNPSIEPLNLKGKKVVALVLSDDESIRHGTEDALAREISARGGVAVPAYTLLPKDLVHDKERVREVLEQAGVEGVVAIRAVAWNQALLPNLGTYWGSPLNGSFWGCGFWGSGWGSGWGGADAGYRRLDTILIVETLVYSLSQDKLVWAGQSQTTNPSKVGPVIRELSKKMGTEMEKQGLLG